MSTPVDPRDLVGAEEDARAMVAADPSDEPHPYAGWKIRALLTAIDKERARVAALRTAPTGETADAWLQEIIDDRPEGAYGGRDVYDHRGARLALHELIALRARVAELETANAALVEERRQLYVAAQAIGEGARSGYIPRAWEGGH